MRAHIPIVTLLLLIVPIPGLTIATANAEVITVCWDGSGDYLTIQEGIDAASDGDQVVVCHGVYTGAGNKNLDFHGKAITVRSANGPETCIIDCEGEGRGFCFCNTEDSASVLNGFTIMNGNAQAGAGILCTGSSPTVMNCMLLANAAEHVGGGVSCDSDSNPTISNIAIIGNSASSGGGISCHQCSSPTITNSLIVGNAAELGGLGGGLYCCRNSSPTISACFIVENSANRGGGVACEGGSPVITDCLVMRNTASGDSPRGGGAYLGGCPLLLDCVLSENAVSTDEWAGYAAGGGVYGRGDPVILSCTISSNVVTGTYVAGGGLLCDGGRIVNCTIQQNTARSTEYEDDARAHGGGIDADGGTLILNCTVTGNIAGAEGEAAGGGLYAGDVTISGCTIAENAATGGKSNLAGAVFTFREATVITNSILWLDWPDEIAVGQGAAYVTYSNVKGGWPGMGNIDADPLFADPENHVYRLALSSPCIDAGCNWAVPPDVADLDDDNDTSEITPLDLDGEGRFFDDPDTDDTGCGCPPIVDMGAYEFGGTGPQPCPGDLDCDRDVNEADLGILLAAWHVSADGDLNCDGDTDHADLGILLHYWGEVCP